jgi:hypothetical protein
MRSCEDTYEALNGVLAWLRTINESAAASLAEGFEETLTVHRLGVGGTPRRALITTNPIESAIDIVRSHPRRVQRWIPALIAALENMSLLEGKDVA